MYIVLTGATSFLGLKLLDVILNHGHECYVIIRPESIYKVRAVEAHPHLHIISSDIVDINKWRKHIPRCDLFFHLAWSGEGAVGRADSAIQAQNVEVTLACLQVARELNCKRFLFAGSQAEYGATDDFVDETHACCPIIEYGKGKLEVWHRGRELAKHLNMEYVHCRIFSVYGQGDHPWTLVSQCIDAFLKGQEVDLSMCSQLWNYLHIDDAAMMIYLLGVCHQNSDSEVYNVAGKDTRPLKDFVNEIWKLAGYKGKPNFGGRVNTTEKAYGINPCVDKLLETIQWEPQVSFEDGIVSMMRNE